MRTALRVLTAAALLGCAQARPPVAAAGSRVPVVVELFTSDGCSSCPPADRVFSGLVQNQPIPDAEVIGLGMHVDYWDQLGWKDPASLALATARQQAYGRVWGADRVYTPQAVVDGAAETVGSDEAAVRRAIERAAAQPHARVSETVTVDGNVVAAMVTVDAWPAAIKEPLDAVLYLTEDALTSNVKFGENAGRTLHHDAVVRAMSPLGRVSAGGRLQTRATLQPQWGRDHMHAVAVVQGHGSHRIWGAATAPVR
jgi:hypothetical protein